MRAHEIDYELFGDDMQLVEITLDQGETVIAEAGAMSYMASEIKRRRTLRSKRSAKPSTYSLSLPRKGPRCSGGSQ